MIEIGFTGIRSGKPFQPTMNIQPLTFPKDHGKHPDSQTEWWYVSGNLVSDDGNQWGYQFAIFRQTLSWKFGIDKVVRLPLEGFVGHLAITNIAARSFVFFQSGRPSWFNLAGAGNGRLDVWMNTWTLKEKDSTIQLKAEKEDFALSLNLVSNKPPVLHGQNGLSIKDETANAVSNHYSLTSLRTHGVLKWQKQAYPKLKCLFMSGYTANAVAHNGVLDEGVAFHTEALLYKKHWLPRSGRC